MLTCVCLGLLMLTVIFFAVVATRSRKAAAGGDQHQRGHREYKGRDGRHGCRFCPGFDAEPTPSVAEPVDNNKRRTQTARNNGSRRRTVAAAPKKPQKGGFFNKLKRAIKKPF